MSEEKRVQGARDIALDALMQVERANAWSDEGLRRGITRGGLDSRDAALAARIAYGVAGPVPMRAPSAEAQANGCPVCRETVDAFAQAVLQDIHPRDSWRASKAFREHIAVELARRCLIRSIELAGGAVK